MARQEVQFQGLLLDDAAEPHEVDIVAHLPGHSQRPIMISMAQQDEDVAGLKFFDF